MYCFDEANHVHTFNGKRLYGVTTVLKNWGDPNLLVNWAVKTAVDAIESGATPEEARTAHTKVRDKAGDKGTEVHKELEDVIVSWIENGEPKLTNEHSTVTKSVIGWLLENNIRPLESEIKLYSENLWLGGICDLIVEKEGKQYIMDFKTSGTVQTKYFFQMGAYSRMYTDMTGNKIHGACIIHIPRGKSFNSKSGVYWRYDMEELEQAFVSILNVFKLDKKLEETVYC